MKLRSNSSVVSPNPELNLAPFSRWTLRDKAAQRRLCQTLKLWKKSFLKK